MTREPELENEAAGRVLSAWRARVAAGDLAPDPAQADLAVRLDRLAGELDAYTPVPQCDTAGGWFRRLRLTRGRTPPPPPRGLYIWGDVGRGKSMLMDLFFAALATRARRRIHFHDFMREVHAALTAWRRQPRTNARDDQAEPLCEIARVMSHDLTVLCLDELEIQDIGDAMIVGRLFAGLLCRGVVVVATSNRPPRDLYKDGLQRERFLPFVELILSRLDVAELAGPQDYRLGRLTASDVYLTPLSPATAERFESLFSDLCGSLVPAPAAVEVLGRRIPVPAAAGALARFSFSDLCRMPLGPADYMAIADRFSAVLVEGVPVFDDSRVSEARRFVTMVDVFYDRKVKLLVSAAAAPADLHRGRRGGFEFQRTASRLVEMQSRDYLSHLHECNTDYLHEGNTSHTLDIRENNGYLLETSWETE